MRVCLKIASAPTLSKATKQALIEQTEITSVTVLMSNSPTDLRTILMFQNPQNLEDANSIVLNHSLIEQQINARSYNPPSKSFQQPFNKNPPSRTSQPSNNFQYSQQPSSNFRYAPQQPIFTNYSQNFQPNQNRNFSTKPVFPSQPINIQRPVRPVQHNFPTNRQVFGPPKNAFHKGPTGPREMPTPMSVCTTSQSRNSQRPPIRHNHFQNFGQKPNFGFTELTYIGDATSEENFEPENPPSDISPEIQYTDVQCFDNNLDSEQYYFSDPAEDENFPSTSQTTNPP